MPNSGRIILSQISSGSAIPLAAILLLGLPDDPSSAAIHGLVLFIMGFMISWNSPATNKYVSFGLLYHSLFSEFFWHTSFFYIRVGVGMQLYLSGGGVDILKVVKLRAMPHNN